MSIGGWSYHRDLYDCANVNQTAQDLCRLVKTAVEIAGLRMEGSVSGDFPPETFGDNHGSSIVTLVCVLNESHLAIHTWPAGNFVSIDLYTCGDREKAKRAVEVMSEAFKPGYVEETVLRRGRRLAWKES